MSNPWVIVVLLLILIRIQLRPIPIGISMFTLPVLMLAYGIYGAAEANVQSGEAVSLFLGVVMGAGVGLLQGKMARIYETDQTWWMAGSWLTVSVWLISIPFRYAITNGFVYMLQIPIGLTGTHAYVPYLLSIAGIFLGKQIMGTIRCPKRGFSNFAIPVTSGGNKSIR